jgi:hypothetical protein
MRLIVSACLAVSLIAAPALIAPASAAPIVIDFDDGAQTAAAQLPSMVDSCVASLMLRNDAAVCRSISMWVVALQNEVKKAQAAAAKKAADDAAPKSAADAKKAADDAAKTKPADAAAPVDKPEPVAPE